jgi:hypothetical protein
MLKFVFLCLLLANALLFAFHQGHLESLLPSGREPTRAANQLNADKIKLVPPPAPSSSAAVAPAASTATAQASANESGPKKDLLACTEIGNFTTVEARRFEARFAESPIAGKLSRRSVQETSSHMIMIPPQDGKEGAERKAAELRKLGVADFYVMQENTDQRWAISLGIFKNEEAARMRMALLNQQGVRSARLIEYRVPLNRIAFQLRDLDSDAQSVIDKVKSDFPRQEIRSCE